MPDTHLLPGFSSMLPVATLSKVERLLPTVFCLNPLFPTLFSSVNHISWQFPTSQKYVVSFMPNALLLHISMQACWCCKNNWNSVIVIWPSDSAHSASLPTCAAAAMAVAHISRRQLRFLWCHLFFYFLQISLDGLFSRYPDSPHFKGFKCILLPKTVNCWGK